MLTTTTAAHADDVLFQLDEEIAFWCACGGLAPYPEDTEAEIEATRRLASSRIDALQQVEANVTALWHRLIVARPSPPRCEQPF